MSLTKDQRDEIHKIYFFLIFKEVPKGKLMLVKLYGWTHTSHNYLVFLFFLVLFFLAFSVAVAIAI